MDDSTMFMQWAIDTLEHEHPVSVVNDGSETTFPSLHALRDVAHAGFVFSELITDSHAANSGSSGETDGSGDWGLSRPAAMENDVEPPSPNPGRRGPRPVTSWNFSAAFAQPAGSDGTTEAAPASRPYEPGAPEKMTYGSQPTRKASARSAGPASAPYAQDHIIAERKRREKINRRFIELSTVIPGLKKMDKATILSDATKHVRELQEKIKTFEAAGSNGRSIDTVVFVKKPCLPAQDDNVSPSSASGNRLPEIEERFSEDSLMVRVHCKNGKGVVVRVLSEVEEVLHLTITHTNVILFTACTIIVTITAKVEEGFTATTEEIVGRLNSALQQHI